MYIHDLYRYNLCLVDSADVTETSVCVCMICHSLNIQWESPNCLSGSVSVDSWYGRRWREGDVSRLNGPACGSSPRHRSLETCSGEDNCSITPAWYVLDILTEEVNRENMITCYGMWLGCRPLGETQRHLIFHRSPLERIVYEWSFVIVYLNWKMCVVLTGMAQLGSSLLINWILTVMFLAEVKRFVRFSLRGYTYSTFL